MTAHNQPHKYRCEACKEWSQQTCPLYASDIASDGDFDFQLLQDITELVGCASHSDAGKAEQRIADVITELKQLRLDAINESKRLNNIEISGMAAAYTKALKVLGCDEV